MIAELTQSISLILRQTQQNLDFLGRILLVLWAIFFITRVIRPLLLLGIIPRRLVGLPGIVCAPFLHANFNHLFFNSIPLLVLSNFILIQGIPYYTVVTSCIIVISGLLIWCFASSGLYVGASAVITGYWGFLIADLYRAPNLTAFILGLISVYYFFGIFLGVFPGGKGASWQGHLFGLLAGLMTWYIEHRNFF